MKRIYKGEPCFSLEEAQALGREAIYKEAEVLRANLRKYRNNEVTHV